MEGQYWSLARVLVITHVIQQASYRLYIIWSRGTPEVQKKLENVCLSLSNPRLLFISVISKNSGSIDIMILFGLKGAYLIKVIHC